MAEVHVFGQIEGASDFPDHRLFCKWGLHFGGAWRVLAGEVEGQTQVDLPQMEPFAAFAHPIDVHFATKGIQGWPKLHFQVFHHDQFGRNEIYGYGMAPVPTSPGMHDIMCTTWRPQGTFREEVTQYFLGGGPQLKHPDMIYSLSGRQNMRTVSAGNIHLKLNVITRNFDKYGIEC